MHIKPSNIKISIISIFLFVTLGIIPLSFASSKPLPSTVRDAVLQSGGVYGIIDPANPDSARSFVDTIFSGGLTGSVDVLNQCSNIKIFAGVEIYCNLEKSLENWYEYSGKRGEIITIKVKANDFLPELKITDADGNADFYPNDKKIFTIKKTLEYTGNYSIGVLSSDYEELKGSRGFTISLESDKKNLIPDDKDNLVEYGRYTVSELNTNLSTKQRIFDVSAYVISIYEAPFCPPNQYCEIFEPPHITISDYNNSELKNLKDGRSGGLDYHSPIQKVFVPKSINTEAFKIDQKYDFKVKVSNISQTNRLNNDFGLVSYKEIDENAPVTPTYIPNIINIPKLQGDATTTRPSLHGRNLIVLAPDERISTWAVFSGFLRKVFTFWKD
jgi:hypothetical protein